MNWTKDLVLAFKTPDVLKRILFVLLILGIFRLIANIPVPGVDIDALQAFLDNPANQFFGILNIFSGGALSQLSIAMLGLGPYITSTIILQLLTIVFPKLKRIKSRIRRRRKKEIYSIWKNVNNTICWNSRICTYKTI